MTTVVYRRGTMASDSLATRGSQRIPGSVRKVWRFEDQTLMGGTGDIFVLMDAIVGANTPQDVKLLRQYSGSEILFVRADGSMLLNSCDALLELGSPEFYALGSGSLPALGALYRGATAEEAVIAASQVDMGTDNRVQSFIHSGPPELPPLPTARQLGKEPVAAAPLLRRLFKRRVG